MPNENRFRVINWPLMVELQADFETFRELKKEIKRMGHFSAETPFDQLQSTPHVYSWYQTNQAMVMLLSNHTVQVQTK